MKKQSKKNINEDTWPGSFIPLKIRDSFRNNVRNAAQAGGPNAVERFVKMFYDRYHDKVMNKEFTIDALLNYARAIENDVMGSMHINPFAVGQQPEDLDYIEHMHEEFEHGIGSDTALSGEFSGADNKGKNYYANNGIWNCNVDGSPVKMWVTATFLGHRRLVYKLGGARWGTITSKRIFDCYSIKSDSVLVVVKTADCLALVQCSANGIERAYDDKDTPFGDEEVLSAVEQYMGDKFDAIFSKASEICEEETEFFESKTSKTYDRLSENKRHKNMEKNRVKINESELRDIVMESVKMVLKEYTHGATERLYNAFSNNDSYESPARSARKAQARDYLADRWKRDNGLSDDQVDAIADYRASGMANAKVPSNVLRNMEKDDNTKAARNMAYNLRNRRPNVEEPEVEEPKKKKGLFGKNK